MTETHSPEETLAFGRRLGRGLKPGCVVALCGPVGAGKTHLVRGLVEGLGGSGETASPTFALIHEYPTPAAVVMHFDLYRMRSAAEVFEAGFDELHDARAVVVLEWADKFPEIVPPGASWVKLVPVDETTRRIVVQGEFPP